MYRANTRQIRYAAAAAMVAVAPLCAAGISHTAAYVASATFNPQNDDTTAAHVLDRLGYGPRPGDVETVRRMGILNYIDQQLHPERIDDSALEARLAPLSTIHLSTMDIARDYYLPAQQEKRRQQQAQGQLDPPSNAPGGGAMTDAMLKQRQVIVELDEQKILRAVYSERQLEQVLTDFWFNHFNVFAGKGPERIMLTEYERDVIRPHVLGSFRDLLGATAHSPAMLFYLDNWMSTDRGLNENYGRELMELHTLGVDGGYTQNDVVEVARAFTGWTIAQPRLGGGYRFNARMHDNGEKHVLGHTIRAGGGERDGEQVLDILARHPSTAKFVATKLARRFVGDAPPQALIDRASKRFLETNGDLREVVRTILLSPEFFAADAYRAKVKTPFEFVASTLRAVHADVRGGNGLMRAMQQLGMPLYLAQPPTGYADTADAWVNTGGLVNRMNFALAVVQNLVPGVRVDVPTEQVDVARDRLLRTLLQGNVSDATRNTLNRAKDAAQLTALALGAPEFQRR